MILRLSKSEQILVEDFVQFKRFAIKGRVCEEVAGVPGPVEMRRYAEVLQAELDGFFEDNPQLRHRVDILYDNTSRTGMIDVELLKNSRGALRVKVRPIDDAASADFQRAQQLARQRRGQWLYFHRNLRMYEGSRVLLLKPLERLHWLRGQALLDADTIIAETMGGKLRPDAAGDHRLSAAGAWTRFPLIAELEHTYATRHTRPTLGNITIYHTLLDFRGNTATG